MCRHMISHKRCLWPRSPGRAETRAAFPTDRRISRQWRQHFLRDPAGSPGLPRAAAGAGDAACSALAPPGPTALRSMPSRFHHCRHFCHANQGLGGERLPHRGRRPAPGKKAPDFPCCRNDLSAGTSRRHRSRRRRGSPIGRSAAASRQAGISPAATRLSTWATETPLAKAAAGSVEKPGVVISASTRSLA